jgi:hypothetical protein
VKDDKRRGACITYMRGNESIQYLVRNVQGNGPHEETKCQCEVYNEVKNIYG